MGVDARTGAVSRVWGETLLVRLAGGEMRRHLDNEGRPLCGAKPAGAFVVEQRRSATCELCVLLASRVIFVAPAPVQA